MKYIKLFEDQPAQKAFDKKYWLVKTAKPYFEISLRKIGMPEREIERFKSRVKDNGYISKYSNMYITSVSYYNSDGAIKQIWQLQFFKANYKAQLERDFYEFKGKVNITPDEIEEWNMKNIANKYNL
jgi:hypothetical protein